MDNWTITLKIMSICKEKKETVSKLPKALLWKNTLHTIYDSILAHDSLCRPRTRVNPSRRPRDIAGKTPSTSCTHDQLSLKLCKERESRIYTNLSDCSPVPTASLVCYRSCSRPRTPLPAGNHDRAASSRA